MYEPLLSSVMMFLWGVAGFIILYRPLRWLGLRFGLVARRDFRRKNPWSVALIGGPGIFITLLTGCWFFNATADNFNFLLGTLLLVAIGVVDDKIEMRARPRLLMQLSVVVGWLCLQKQGTLISDIAPDYFWILRAALGFWIIGCINAMNMIDGADRLAGGVGVICTLAFAALTANAQLGAAMILLAGGCAGFLVFNNRGKIYLGESGSTLLGFALATTGARLQSDASVTANILAPLLILSYPCMDACYAMARRLRMKESMFRGDRDHFHHKLKNIGLNPRAVTGVLHWICFYSAFAAWSLAQSRGMEWPVLFLSAFGMLSVLGALLVTERLLAIRIGQYSKTLIEKHLPIIRRDVDPREGDSAFVGLDLLPYYKDLQRLGLVRVEQFIEELAAIVKKNCGEAPLYLAGSYTLLIAVEGDQQPVWTRGLVKDFHTLVARSKVTINQGDTPVGIEFYRRGGRLKRVA